MNPLLDYFYRFPHEHQHNMPGRCRVRIYKRKNGAHTVVLTELDSNAGESVTSACERIATNLVADRRLNPKTTHWIQHDPPHDDQPQVFDELQFVWEGNHSARDPQWQRLSAEQAEALTGASLSALNRRLGDFELQVDEGANRAGSEAKRPA